MSTIFTKIINGEIPSYKVVENEDFFVFLDINPNAKGHTLVVPKQEANKLFELEEDIKMISFFLNLKLDSSIVNDLYNISFFLQ